MTMEYTIEPCRGIAADVRKGQTVTVVDAEGGQVADFLRKCGETLTNFFRRA